MISVQLFAQSYPITGITISLPANPDANTANWGSGVSMLTIMAATRLTYGKVDAAVMDSKILVTIKKNGSKICGVYTANSAPSSNFNTVTKVWSSKNAVSLLGQDCVLLPGDYEICVQFFGYGATAIVPLSDEKCKTFSIKPNGRPTYLPPQAITPANITLLSESAAKKPISFRWTPIIPKPRETVTYRVAVWQLMQGQTGSQAMKTNQPFFTKDVDNLTQTVINNLVSGPCLPPYLCEFVWNVQALGKDGKPFGENNGNSNANLFTVNNDNLKSLPATNPVDSGTAAIGDSIRAGLNGEFTVIVSDITTETDGSLTGKGKVRIPWLKTYVAVEFKKIRIDTTKRLTSGGIVSTESGSTNTSYDAYPKAWALSLLSGPGVANATDIAMTWSNNLVNNLVSWVNNVAPGNQPLINYKDTIPTPPVPNNTLKMPFGLQFHNGNDLLVITEMIFKPNESKINFLAQKLFTKGITDYKLGFAGKYFKIHPHNIEFSNGRVELVEDMDVPNLAANPTMKFTFKKGVPANGCYIEWDSTGVKDIGIGLDVKFTRDWLLPVPTAPDSVKATISGNGTSLHDILLTGSLPNCEIVGTNGIKILADSISLDLSDTRNPASMHFPSNYTSDTSAQGKLLWQGLYIKTLGLTLPDTWKTGSNPTQITATHTLIDDYGVTMQAKAINVISFPLGRVSDMSASLDTFQVSILKGSLTNASAKGKLVLPISRDTISNTLKYTATFAQVGGTGNFQIVIIPTGPIDADIFKGRMTLNPTSNITASLSGNLKTMSIALNGHFDWGNKDLSVTDTSTATGASPIRKKGIKGIRMEMDFENVSLAYTNNSVANTNTLSFNPGTWSFASPQKRLANFPVSIKKVYYKSLSTVANADPNTKELVRGALMIDIVANLTDDIGGATTVGAAFAIERNTGTNKFNPKFKGVFIEDISVHADMSAVKIDGSLKMYDHDPTYGDGFLATLGVTFTAVSLQVNALVQFGNTTWNNNGGYYRYWRAEADAKFEPGIPFLTGVGFYGFGGGAFYNMKANLMQRAAPEVGFTYVFEPKKSSLGFVANATIGTMPKVETFNADVSLLAQFNSSTGGLTMIGFTGNFWMAAKLTERADAKLLGGVVINYNFPTKVFNLAGALTINAGPAIETLPNTPLGLTLHIDGQTNKWYFKCGVPTNPNTVKVFGINLYSYFMFGNDLGTDVPNGFTAPFVTDYNNTFPGHPISGPGDGGAGLTTTGKGIALGVGLRIDQDLSSSLPSGTIRDWNFNFKFTAGAELDMALLQYTGACNGINPVGIRGYRASGGLGFYANVAASIAGRVRNRHNSILEASSLYYWSDKNYSICDIRGGGWISGAFPNPVYAHGAIDGSVSVFDDLLSFNFHKEFTYGTDCGAMTQDAGPAVTEEDKAGNLMNKLIQYVNPAAHYNFPVTATINVKYGLVPGQVFDVAENEADGSIKNRTFKLTVVRKLEIQNTDGTWAPVMLQTKANIIGEYQYYIKPPLSNTLSQANNAWVPSMAGQVNANNGSTLIATNGALKTNSIPATVPPPPLPNYPNPVPDPVNHLSADKEYRFVVTATLMELTGSSWNTAVTKTGAALIETKTKLFRTGSMPMSQANTTIPKANHL